jgi:hypothetical protein
VNRHTREFLGLIYDQIEKECVKQENSSLKEKKIKPNPDKEWAVYNSVKHLHLSPIWQLLFMGDEKAWDYLGEMWAS